MTAVLVATWRDRAECRNRGTNLWFPISPNETAVIEAAKAFCARCPVTAECLAAGATEEFGIWGGLTEQERKRLRKGGAA